MNALVLRQKNDPWSSRFTRFGRLVRNPDLDAVISEG